MSEFMKRKIKEPRRPKRPLSAYMVWLQAMRPILKRRYPDLKLVDFTKKAGELWHQVGDRAQWERQAGKLRSKYLRDVTKYRAKLPKKPKRPMSAFIFWLTMNRANLKNKHPDASATDISREGGRVWRSMSSAEREKWQRKAKQIANKSMK